MEDASEIKSPEAINDHITMYVNDELVWGIEPDGTTPKPSEPTTKPTAPSTTTAPTSSTTTTTAPVTTTEPEPSTDPVVKWGDANCDGDVGIADAVDIMSYVSNSTVYPLTPQGLINADVYANGDGLSNMDALSVQKLLANILNELPES